MKIELKRISRMDLVGGPDLGGNKEPRARFRQIWNSLLDSPKKLFEGPAVPFISVYATTHDFQLPAKFEFQIGRGLALLHLTESSTNNGQLLAYWRSESHFRTHRTCLERELCLDRPTFAGTLSDMRTPKQRWWEHFSVKDWLISAAAVVTAFTLLQTEAAFLIEVPHVQVAFSDLTPLIVTSHDLLTSGVDAQNDSLYTKASLTGIHSFVTSQDSNVEVPLTPDYESLPPLGVGEEKKFSVTGSAPQRRTDHGPPEKYTMVITGTAKAGLLRRSRLIEIGTPREVDVWPSDIGWGLPTITAGGGMHGMSRDAAQVNIVLYPGKSYVRGIIGVIPVISQRGEIVKLVAADETEEFPPQHSSNSTTCEIEFHTKPLQHFVPYNLIVTLESSQPLDQHRWSEIVNAMQIMTN